MRTKTFLSALLLCCCSISFCYANMQTEDVIRDTSLPIPSYLDDEMPIKILLQRTRNVTVGSFTYVNAYNKKTGAFIASFMNSPLVVSLENNDIYINGQRMGYSDVYLVSPAKQYIINDRQYSGALTILKRSEQLLVINEVDLETYLKGVLPSEMYAQWPLEALKAQAVASRTYAVFSAIERRDQDFHVADTVFSQVYGGKSAQKESTDKAVDATRGEILTYDNEVFPAYFHSTCGGATTRAEYVWKVRPHPSLIGVYCPFCWESKYYSWSQTITLEEIEKRLLDKGVIDSDLVAIKKGSVDTAGRMIQFEIETDQKLLTVDANDVRVFVFPDIMKSTKFSIEASEKALILNGNGWGHGVGMCQYGANKMAADGYDYKVIVNFYYSYVTLSRLPDGNHEYYDLILR